MQPTNHRALLAKYAPFIAAALGGSSTFWMTENVRLAVMWAFLILLLTVVAVVIVRDIRR